MELMPMPHNTSCRNTFVDVIEMDNFQGRALNNKYGISLSLIGGKKMTQTASSILHKGDQG